MSETATGVLAVPTSKVRDMIAATSAWQSWTVSQNEPDPAASAAEHVYLAELPAPEGGDRHEVSGLEGLRPFAIVDPEPGEALGLIPHAGGTRQFMVGSGLVVVDFEADVPQRLRCAGSEGDALIWFMNQLGAVVGGLEELAGTAGYLTLQSVTVSEGPQRSSRQDETTQGDFIFARVGLRWGLEAG